MELLFFAYRDFTGEPDKILVDYGFGRAHHRVIYFVGRNPGITVSELLAILRITKQSLSRVLGQLVREGFITQRPGLRDRRQRLLALTDKGRELENKLRSEEHTSELQSLMRISYAVFCLKKKTTYRYNIQLNYHISTLDHKK